LDSCQEGSHEQRDRGWRRWLSFCDEAGVPDPFLGHLPDSEQELLVRAFFGLYRVADWAQSGRLRGQRKSPMVATTLRTAASNLAAAFGNHFKRSPLHVKDGTQLLPSLRALLRAYDNVDPPPNRQKAVTPKLLRCLWSFARTRNIRASLYEHAVDLLIGAYFFAMRPCEFVKTPRPGKTKRAKLSTLIFRDSKKQILAHTNPLLLSSSEYVTVVFIDQKNGTKMDHRTQRKTGHRFLCPVLRFGRAVRRIVLTVPRWTPDTPLCALQVDDKTLLVTSTFTKSLLRHTCHLFGGLPTFGFLPTEIGNRSIRPGAAMSLFLMHHPKEWIMILGRWASDAFLVYIRPQVLEWTNNMSKDMIKLDSFLDVGRSKHAPPIATESDKRPRHLNGRTSTILIPKFHLHH
jgi:hypothetical protein